MQVPLMANDQDDIPQTNIKTAPPTRVTVIVGAVTTVCFVVGLLASGGVLYKPKIRGFYLNDPSIGHPTGTDTVNGVWLLINYVLVLLIVAAMQILRPTLDRYSKIQSVMMYILGIGLTLFFHNSLKYFVSEFRPDFISRCKPDPASLVFDNSSGLNTTSAFGPFVLSYKCTGAASLVLDGRLGMPSGHATDSFYSFIYLFVSFPFTLQAF
jgi:diacylglycerol diphosphate phosphatase/phosphatidate phosphatase